jgi:hypothetical protein
MAFEVNVVSDDGAESRAGEIETNLQCLLEDLGVERTVMLVDLIRAVMETTGYGNVSIVINDRRVETIKQEFSYK